MTERKPKAPSGLGKAGRSLWAKLIGEFEFQAHELAVLELACRQADDVALLEVAVADDGVIVAGAAGQRRLNGAVSELRQSRLAVGKLLGLLAIPDEEGKPAALTTVLAQKAAAARWRPKRTEEQRRDEALRREMNGGSA